MILRSDMKVDLIDFMGGDDRVVQTARVSTKGSASREGTAGTGGLIRYLMREGHHVPFEHSVFTFYIEAPIFVTRQILKHRISSISETSGRYRELGGEFYIPADERPLAQVGKTGDYNFEPGDDAQRVATQATIWSTSAYAWEAYEQMLSSGIAKEVARQVLPLNLYSQMYLSVNTRSLMNFINLRTEHTAQYEIKEVAKQMETFFAQEMPLTYNAYKGGTSGA